MLKKIISGIIMRLLARLLVLSALILGFTVVYAGSCGGCQKNQRNCKQTCDTCCQNMGGISYCDSSAGRLVCNNGSYSSCYCTRHAIMDLQHIQGCCLWQGGVMTTDPATGLVICNDGGVSAVCSLQPPPQSIATW
jgi:hypothetical protein